MTMSRIEACILILLCVPFLSSAQRGQRNRNRNRPRGSNTSVGGGSTGTGSESGDLDGLNFLENTGYLDIIEGDHGHDETSIARALKEFQKFTGLSVTGRLDRATRQKMRDPRCGVPDVIRPSLRPSSLRATPDNPNVPLAYNAPGYKWESNDISYRINDFTSKVQQSQTQRAIYNAFQKWAEVTPLTFRRSSGDVNIDITFRRGQHEDGPQNRFDGRGGTLAHAFFPGGGAIAGDTHFDEDEEWTVNTPDGTNLEIVAAHEFGHALGLGHSSDPKALMAPFYRGYNASYGLLQDDIRGIQSLYGPNRGGGGRPPTRRPTQRPRTRAPRTPRPTRPTRRTRRPRTPRPTRPTRRTRRPRTPRPTRPTRRTRRPRTQRPTRPPRPTRRPTTGDTCDLRFDAIEQVRNGHIYAFSGNDVYQITRDGPTNRRRIRDVFRGAPSSPGAAVYDRYTNKLYFFKGRRVWRFTDYRLDDRYPQTLPDDFRNIRAAMQWNDGGIFVFKGRDYSRWREGLRGYPRGYPRATSSYYYRAPMNIDATYRSWDGYLYIFKGHRYWKYTSQAGLSPGFPKDSKPVWLNCNRPSRIRANSMALSYLTEEINEGEAL